MGLSKRVGVGWRPALGPLLSELRAVGTLGFSEVVAENLRVPLPLDLAQAIEQGLPVVAHGVGLGLAGAQRPDPARLARLATAAERLRSPLVSEHVAFVRTGTPERGAGRETRPQLHPDVLEAGHLVPGPRTRESLDVLVDNVREAMEALPVPLAMENPAATWGWPEDEIDEPDFLTELTERTGCLLLLDLHNVYVSCRAAGTDPARHLERMPLERVAYVHVAGGAERQGVYEDTHAHDIPDPVFGLLARLRELCRDVPGVLIERDEAIEPDAVRREHAAVRRTLGLASSSRPMLASGPPGPMFSSGAAPQVSKG